MMQIYEDFSEFLAFIQPRTTQIVAHCMPINESCCVCASSDAACVPGAQCRRPVHQDEQPQAQKLGTTDQSQSVQWGTAVFSPFCMKRPSGPAAGGGNERTDAHHTGTLAVCVWFQLHIE